MVNEPSTFQGEGPMACRRMNPQDIGPSLPTVVNVMKELSDGVGGWEEKQVESEAETSTETVRQRVRREVEVKGKGT